MATVRILGSSTLQERVEASVGAEERRTLLSVMRERNLPHHLTCSEGRCGSCAVKVAPFKRTAGAGSVRLSELERKLLYRTGKLSRQQVEAEVLADIPPLWRLACQYVVQDEDIMVVF
jgi:ferredoxin